MNNTMKCKIWFLIVVALTLTAVAMPEVVPPAYADVPDVMSIIPWTSGTDTVLNITVRHGLPTGSHYIYKVEVDVAGTVNTINLGTPQTETFFVVQYSMGSLTTTPTVRARAFCTVHGVGPFSQQVVVSEFSALSIILIIAIVSVAVLLIKLKFPDLKKRAFLGSKTTSAP